MKLKIISRNFASREIGKILLEEELQPAEIECIDSMKKIQVSNFKDTDIAIIHISREDKENIEVIKNLKENNPQLKIIVFAYKEIISKILEYKVDGYALELNSRNEFNNIIKKVINNEKYYSPEVVDIIIEIKQNANVEYLTNREKEVIRQLGKGLTNKDISKELFITEYTVKKHITSIFNKLNLKNRSEAILYIQKHQII